jgi:hypothetical protein
VAVNVGKEVFPNKWGCSEVNEIAPELHPVAFCKIIIINKAIIIFFILNGKDLELPNGWPLSGLAASAMLLPF